MAPTTQTNKDSWFGLSIPDNVVSFYERVYGNDQNVAHWTTKQGGHHSMAHNRTFESINAVIVAMKLS